MLTLDRTFDFHGDAVAWGRIDGPDMAPPAVLIHGFPWSAQASRRIAPWLARHHSVYYFDMLGCGQSARHADQDVSPAVQNEWNIWGLPSDLAGPAEASGPCPTLPYDDHRIPLRRVFSLEDRRSE